MPSPLENTGRAVPASAASAGAGTLDTSSAAAGGAVIMALPRKPIALWPIFAALSSWLLVIIVLSPLLVALWGSFTTLDTLGAASSGGAGWESVTTSAAEREAQESAKAGGEGELGFFASGARRVTGSVTTLWYKYVWEVYGKTIKLSLMLAAMSIVTCIVVGVFGGYALVRYKFFGKNLIEEMILLPLSLPGIAVAVALIETYGILRGNWVIILFGHLLYTLPFMMQSITNTLRSFDFVTLELAASSLGANAWQRLRYILLPNLKHAIIVGSLLVFAISLGEFNASFLLSTPINQVFPAALYDAYTNDSFQVSSAATTMFMVVVVPALISIQFIGGKEMQEAGAA